MESEYQCECGRKMRSQTGITSDMTRSGVTKVRNDDTLRGGDRARFGQLGRVNVCQHHRSQWKVVNQVSDPVRCDRLMLLTTNDPHLHHPIGVRDEIVTRIHVVRLMLERSSIEQSKNETTDRRMTTNET